MRETAIETAILVAVVGVVVVAALLAAASALDAMRRVYLWATFATIAPSLAVGIWLSMLGDRYYQGDHFVTGSLAALLFVGTINALAVTVGRGIGRAIPSKHSQSR